MSYKDITFCRALHCKEPKRGKCYRSLENVQKELEAKGVIEDTRLSVSDFSTDVSGKKAKDCTYFIKRS